jgi:Family of unknown function (DUF6114)
MNAQQTTDAYPNTASILAIIGGCFMLVAGFIILSVSAFVIPHLNSSFFNGSMYFNDTSHPVPFHDFQGFVGGVLTGVGLFGLVSGLIVVGSGFMLRIHPEHRSAFGVLILVFSVLSFFGSGGFVIGAILGIIGGIMTLSWRSPAASQPVTPTSVPVA